MCLGFHHSTCYSYSVRKMGKHDGAREGGRVLGLPVREEAIIIAGKLFLFLIAIRDSVLRMCGGAIEQLRPLSFFPDRSPQASIILFFSFLFPFFSVLAMCM